MYDPYTDEGLRKLIFAVHTPRDPKDSLPIEDTWLRGCMEALYALYGYAPLAVLATLYNTKAGCHTTGLALLQRLQAIPKGERDFTLQKGQLFSASLDEEELATLQNHPKGEYYVPQAEAISYASLGVMAFMDADTVRRAIHSIEELTGLVGDDVFPILHAVLDMLSHDQSATDITLAMAYFQKLTSPSDQERLQSLVTWLDDRVPKLKYRGYTTRQWEGKR